MKKIYFLFAFLFVSNIIYAKNYLSITYNHSYLNFNYNNKNYACNINCADLNYNFVLKNIGLYSCISIGLPYFLNIKNNDVGVSNDRNDYDELTIMNEKIGLLYQFNIYQSLICLSSGVDLFQFYKKTENDVLFIYPVGLYFNIDSKIPIINKLYLSIGNSISADLYNNNFSFKYSSNIGFTLHI